MQIKTRAVRMRNTPLAKECEHLVSYQVTRPLGAFVLVTSLYLGKCNQPRLITVTSTLIIPDITKTSSNYCLLSEVNFSPAGTYVQKCRLMRFNALYE